MSNQDGIKIPICENDLKNTFEKQEHGTGDPEKAWLPDKETRIKEIKKELDELYHLTKPEPPHSNSKDCWCDPYLDYENPETGSQVWIHRKIE